LIYKVNTSSDQLAVFSEIWYGPNKGWQAYIDNNPVDHVRANYILRALNIPSGTNEVKFVFKPSSVTSGNLIAMISSILLLGAFLFYIVNFMRPDDKKWFNYN